MQLLVVRHAIAEDPLDWAESGLADSLRPLTPKGRARMKRNAAGLVVALPNLDLVASSPFARAAQTAELLSFAYGGVDVMEVAALASGGSRGEVVAWLAGRSENSIAVVGHEPDLGNLVSWLVTGEESHSFAMRKGGACLLRFARHPDRGKAELRWVLTPALLRRVAS